MNKQDNDELLKQGLTQKEIEDLTQPCVAINLNKSSTDMAKLQIKQEKYIYLEDYFLSLPDFEKLIDGRQPRKDYRHFF